MKRDYNKALHLFSSLADETRLKMLVSIMDGPKNVTQIHKSVDNVTLSAISHQLKLLHSLGIVNSEKKGREKYFQLSPNFCWCILRDAFEHKTGCKECSKMVKNSK
ncbi:winged helix-turn-helix transcriptional regulator [Candidatus Woesearchaeota archaeon]|nr:winged helix-turn-helix transcriptional regulator [Candidatus Woesearchaeota archaeon]MBT4151114.1 winged helix-turn-helix transcriptional regulator [Candidatus Woesearchaeota archaeon]MBT4247932.1 winged helix-turn-helix transcriptional regulator [Candidatus Woesearchaeota archaeon]MBT4433929.1 winged helix-turn-helix transcriptional regulator [Candidatus Woesearchaeota archaeon]MBT7332034.1 winged helix-turn-helix transcriptional regulator [Candidatus Woesearchaeota archaeon]